MGESRQEVASRAAAALEGIGASGVGRLNAFVGFDGFVDSIIDVVDVRRSMRVEDYTPIRSIAAFAARIAAAAGRSTNIERIVREVRFGGNGPLMAGALGQLGVGVTFAGAVGKDDGSGEIMDVFRPFAARCRRVMAVGAPGATDAMEFDDGKIMLNRTDCVQAVTWERLVERIGLGGIREEVGRADIIGIVNWSLCGGVHGIWRGLREQVFPAIPARAGRRAFVDLSDPAKRTDEDIGGAVEELARLNACVPVTLGLNLAEAQRLARVLGVSDRTSETPEGESIRRCAESLRRATRLACVVIHPRHGAAGAVEAGSGWIDGPFTRRPALSTGAGDHFNAGFALGQAAGMSLAECLCVGVAVSGAYCRDAQSPTFERLVNLLRNLPAPENSA